MPRTQVDYPQSLVRAGVARGDITPPVGIYHRMWGAATHDRSTGVHRPLTATVLCVSPRSLDAHEPPQVVFIGIDHCLLWTAEINRLLDEIAARTGLERSSITICFSHTHAAGLMDPQRSGLPGGDLIAPYLESLTETLSQLIAGAREAMEPAHIAYGSGRCDLAANRDYFDEHRNGYVCGFNPDGVTDDTLMVARITSADAERTLGTVVNYACHPTTLAWQNTLISPDYVGAMREVVEQVHGAPCLFLQGASGDLGPRESYVGDIEVAERNGRRLGYAALAALESLPPPERRFDYTGAVVSGATLGTWDWREVAEERRDKLECWRGWKTIVELPYRSDLGERTQLESARQRLEIELRRAEEAGNHLAARDARALIERRTRELTRVAALPPGRTYPYPLRCWRMGDAVWLAFDGEHYNVLQRTLRARFPDTPLIIGTIANGSNVWYLPDAESYGKGLYQEEASIFARGALETLIEASTTAIRAALE